MKLTNEEPGRHTKPEETYRFIFAPGYYYLGMWHMPFASEFSKFGRGGCITMLVFRKDTDLMHWYLRWTFRHYAEGPAADPWDGKDWKSRYAAEWDDVDEREMWPAMEDFMKMVAGLGGDGNKLLSVPIRGDSKKVMEMIESGKLPFLHTQQQHSE